MTSLYFILCDRLASLLETGPLGERLPTVTHIECPTHGVRWHSDGEALCCTMAELMVMAAECEHALALVHEDRIFQPGVWALAASMPWETGPPHLMKPVYTVEEVTEIARICERLGMGRVVAVED